MKPRVLVIDDEPDMCETFEMVLEPSGCEVCTASSGEEGIALLGERTFDLVITDYMMPGLDGGETLAAVKAAHPSLAVVVVTGYVTEESDAACRARGAFAILKKPFELSELRAIIKAALAAKSG